MTVAKLEQLIEAGSARMRESLAADKTALVLDGFTASDYTRKRVVEFARAYKASRRKE